MSKPIISLIIIVLSLIFSFFYVRQEYGLVQKHRADFATVSDISTTTHDIENLIDQTQQTLNSVDKEDRARFEVFLPETVDTIRLANDLQFIGLKKGLILENLKVEEVASGVQKSAGGEIADTAQGAAQGAVRGIATVFTIGRKAELSQEAYEKAQAGVGVPASSADKRYIATKASFGLDTTLPVFESFLNDLETSLRLMNVTAFSLAPSSETADMKNTKISGPPIYKFTVAIETYSLK